MLIISFTPFQCLNLLNFCLEENYELKKMLYFLQNNLCTNCVKAT